MKYNNQNWVKYEQIVGCDTIKNVIVHTVIIGIIEKNNKY
jgi:hypothetical protein